MSNLASAAELATNCRKFVGKAEAVIPIRLLQVAQGNDQPFTSCPDGATVDVSFGQTDDPYWYDPADRRSRQSLDEEMQWEEAVAAGETTLDLVTWVESHRGKLAAAVVIELSWLPPWGEGLSVVTPWGRTRR